MPPLAAAGPLFDSIQLRQFHLLQSCIGLVCCISITTLTTVSLQIHLWLSLSFSERASEQAADFASKTKSPQFPVNNELEYLHLRFASSPGLIVSFKRGLLITCINGSWSCWRWNMIDWLIDWPTDQQVELSMDNSMIIVGNNKNNNNLISDGKNCLFLQPLKLSKRTI